MSQFDINATNRVGIQSANSHSRKLIFQMIHYSIVLFLIDIHIDLLNITTKLLSSLILLFLFLFGILLFLGFLSHAVIDPPH